MKNLLTFIVCFTCGFSSFAQTKKVIADKIVAQVGDKIIMRSDILNAISDYKRNGQEAQLPPNPECAFLEGQLIQKALVLQAEKDSLTVSDDVLEAKLDNQIRGFISMYGSKELLEEIAGKTVYQIKDEFRILFKERELADMMRDKIVSSVKITPTEVKAYWEAIPKDSLPFYESELEVSQIILYPKANKAVEEYVSRELYEMKRQVEAGVRRFEDLAKIYSEDPGSKNNGGQYTVNRTERMFDPVFLAAAFKLKEGQISPVIKTKFGLHIIQMVSRNGDDAVVRHILKIPPVTEDEIKETKQKLDSIRSEIQKGTLSFGEAVNKFSEDEGSKFSAGAISGPGGSTFITIDQLDKNAVLAIKNLNEGEISKPFSYVDERQKTAVRILYLINKTQPHRENIKEDYNKIAQRALEEKKANVLEKWFKDRLARYYIRLDSDYEGCENLQDWWKVAAKN